MGKKESLKEQLLKAAKRRAQRSAKAHESSTENQAGAASGDQDQNKPLVKLGQNVRSTVGDAGVSASLGVSYAKSVVTVVDRLARLILDFDNCHEGLVDRHVIAALRGILRGYPSNDTLVRDLFAAIQQSKSEFEVSARVIRQAIEQLIDTFQACGDGGSSSRDALVYLRSVAN